jgi:hypothetical protein
MKRLEFLEGLPIPAVQQDREVQEVQEVPRVQQCQ